MNNINIKIIKDPLFQRIIKHPFKYYSRAAGFTFCLTSLTNLTTTLLCINDPKRQRKAYLINYPQAYFMSLLFKSAYFGILWPSFYFTAVQNPSDVFILGAGIEKIY